VLGACLGATIGGLVEATAAGFGLIAAPASAGYAALLAIPACLVGALLVRGLWAAWRPHRLAPQLIEEGGGAPRLAAWIVYGLVAAFVLSWATFNGVRLVAKLTTFKVDVVALAMPIVVVITAGVLAALSRPAVDVLAAGLRRLDGRLRPRGRSLLAPRVLLGVVLVGGAALLAFAWFVSISPRIGPLDLAIVLHPILAALITAGFHPLWRRAPATMARWALAAPTAAATLGIALAGAWVRYREPSLMLAIWSEPSIGGFAIETMFDVDTLRSRASLERYRPAPRDQAPRRDLLLITIDTVRHDRTPLGGGSAKMPHLAALGRRGAVFERAYAPSNVTRRSMPSIMLGASSPRVRGRVVGWALRLDPRHVTLAERLSIAGYDTAGFFCCAAFWGAEKKTGYSRGLDHVFIDKEGETLAEEASRWLDERTARGADRPAFTWLHFIEPHGWARQKDEKKVKGSSARESRGRRYDKTLAEVDEFLGTLLAAVERMPEARRPIIVVTSDHGEGLGDHGLLHHAGDLYDTQTRVPLVIAGPGIAAARIGETVSLTDLAPTMLELAGFVPPGMPDMDGRSLADLATGARRPDPDGGVAYTVMVKDRSTSHGARAVIRGRWKLIDGPRGLELYDVVADPDESRNRAGEEAERVAELKALLDQRAALDKVPTF
jgi:arylsulfatase A-like enzyme